MSRIKHKLVNTLRDNTFVKEKLSGPLIRNAVVKERARVSRNYFNLIRGIHQGRRGFVIGNGPSLAMEDLTRIENEISIASNLIYLAYGETPWRPSYVTVIDNLVWQKIAAETHFYYSIVIIPDNLSPEISRSITYQFRHIGHAPFVSGKIAFSSDVNEGLFGGSSVTYTNLQLARHLGLNPVYLIGCDHYYKEVKDIKEGIPVRHTSQNHFSEKYRAKGELVNPAPIENMTKSYQVAQRYCEESDFRIFNATRGGHLEVFPRVSLDEIFLT